MVPEEEASIPFKAMCWYIPVLDAIGNAIDKVETSPMGHDGYNETVAEGGVESR